MSHVQGISSCSKTFVSCCFQRVPEWCNSKDQGWLKIAGKIVTMLKNGSVLGGYSESVHSVMNSFSKIFGYSFTQKFVLASSGAPS